MIELGANRYGKAQIRVVRVVRGPGAHRLRDLTVAIALEGDFTPHAAARVLTKDVGLFTDVARSLGLATPMADCAREIFLDTVRRGYAEEDDAAVLKRYRDLYGN